VNTSETTQHQLTFSWAALPANPSPSLDLEEDWTTKMATSPLSFAALLIEQRPGGLSGKTSLVSCHQTKEKTLVPSSGRWQKSGIMSRGESWTLNTSEHPKDADVSFLSDILEPMEDKLQRYCLSPTACKGILRRAEKRGKTLPPLLQAALHSAAQETSSMDLCQCLN